MVERKRAAKGAFTGQEVAVLLEDLGSQFRTFGEGLEDIRGRLAGVGGEAEVREFRDFTTFQKLVSEKLRSDVSSLTAMGRKITADIAAIRDDLRKNTAELTAIRDNLTSSNAHLSTLEAKVGL